MVAFWGCEVTETKAAVVTVPEGFVLNVCNVTCGSSDSAGAGVSLALETLQMDKKPWKGVVAHVGGKTHPWQVKLDLVFGLQHQVKFYLAEGVGAVNLTGYFQPGPPSDLFEEQPVEVAASSKKSKKRSRDEKTTKAKDQVSTIDSEVKASPAKKEQQQKPKETKAASSASVNGGAAATHKKKMRKKHKKVAAEDAAK